MDLWGNEWGLMKFPVKHAAFLVTSLLSVRFNGYLSPAMLLCTQVCTFRLVVKNAASLLGKKDPVKLEAEALLDNLIRYPTLQHLCVVVTELVSVRQILSLILKYFIFLVPLVLSILTI